MVRIDSGVDDGDNSCANCAILALRQSQLDEVCRRLVDVIAGYLRIVVREYAGLGYAIQNARRGLVQV